MSDRLATADGREESDFIAGMKGGAPCSELPIARGYQGGAILLKAGITRSVLREERFDIRIGLNIKRFLGAPGNFFKAAKEENLHADG